jgi:hypothetical protein
MVKKYFLGAAFLFVMSPASAVLTLEICGGANYTCPPPVAPLGDVNQWGPESGIVDVDSVKVSDGASGVAVPIDGAYDIPQPSGAEPTVPTQLRYKYMSGPTAYNTSGEWCAVADAAAKANPNMGTLTGGNCVDYAAEGTALGNTEMYGGYPVIAAIYQITSSVYGQVTYTSTQSAPVLSCPDGYQVSGDSCGLQDARKAVPDNRQDIDRAGGDWNTYPGDKAGTIVGLEGTTNAPGDSLSFVGKNSAGDTTSITFVAQPNGGTTLTQLTQMTDSAGSSFVHESSVTFDSGGNIVSSSGSSFNGSLNTSAPAPDGGATVVNDGAISANPYASGSGGSGGSGGGGWPSDYARSGEAGAAADKILAGIGSGAVDYGSVVDATLATKSVNVAITPVAVSGAGACPASSMLVLHGRTYFFDWTTYCNFAIGIKPILLAFAWLSAAGILVGGFKA